MKLRVAKTILITALIGTTFNRGMANPDGSRDSGSTSKNGTLQADIFVDTKASIKGGSSRRSGGFDFINPGDEKARRLFPDETKLRAWTCGQKEVINRNLAELLKIAPGLVARAMNGEKIPIVLSCVATEETTCDGSTNPLLSTCAAYIKCYPVAFQMSDVLVRRALAHELTHYVDASDYLSASPAWNRTIVPYIKRYRAKFGGHETDIKQIVDPDIASSGLPTSIAAQQAAEALAECTAAHVVGGWLPHKEILEFIDQHILSRPTFVNSEQQLLRMADAAKCARRPSDALSYLNQVLRIDPACTAAWSGQALLWDRLHEPELVEFYANQALYVMWKNGVMPDDRDIKTCNTLLVSSCRGRKNYSQAIGILNKAIARDPGCVGYYEQRAEIAGDMGRLGDAIQDYTIALELDPTDREAYSARGRCYGELGDQRNAIKDFNQSIALGNGNATIFHNRGTAYAYNKQYAAAVKDFSRALRLDANEITYKERASVYMDLGRYNLAASDFTEAIRLNSKEPDYFYNRALAYYRLKAYPRALNDIRKAVVLATGDGDIKKFESDVVRKFKRGH